MEGLAAATIWLSPHILEWFPDRQEGKPGDVRGLARGYELWAHADHVLAHDSTTLARTDALVTLRRAVNQRLRLIAELNDVRALPLRDKPGTTLEILASLGVVRPRMLDRLIKIRDAVEHEDAEPPGLSECESFSEFVWYFLRSTDRLVSEPLDTFILQDSFRSDSHLLEVEKPAKGWNLKLRAWVPGRLVSMERVEGWCFVRALDFEPLECRHNENACGGEPDAHFSGELRGPSECVRRLLAVYFNVP